MLQSTRINGILQNNQLIQSTYAHQQSNEFIQRPHGRQQSKHFPREQNKE